LGERSKNCEEKKVGNQKVLFHYLFILILFDRFANSQAV